VVRLREVRNDLAHLSTPSLDDVTFDILWVKLAGALHRLEDLVNIPDSDRINYVEYRKMVLSLDAMKILQLQLKVSIHVTYHYFT